MADTANLKFRCLRADEVECRVAQCTEKGVSLLLYKNARCDMNILDETVGPMNWQRHHLRDNANCVIAIWDSDKRQWVEKEDTGTESNTEAEKGLASDSFKRAGFNWGIGRELYTAPFIWVSAENCTIKDTGRKDKYNRTVYTCSDRFSVSEMEVSESKVITQLTVTCKGREVYGYGKKSSAPFIKCESCGNEVMPVKKRDGTIWQPPEMAAFSKRKYGKCMCADCMKKADKESDKAVRLGDAK